MPPRVARVLRVVLGALALLGGAWAQPAGGDVTGEALTPFLEAQPRQTLNLQLRLENPGSAWHAVTPEVAVPHGWSVVVPPGEVSLPPGESRVAFFTVLVSPSANAGTYAFPVTYRTSREAPRHEVLFTVAVPRIDRVELVLLDGPSHVPDEAYRVRFLLRNAGNSRHDWELEAGSGLGLDLDVEPASVPLGPGESAEVVVRVPAHRNLTEARTHAVRLTARSRSLPDVQATAQSAAELIPRGLPASSALHRFPLTVRAAYGVGSASAKGGLAGSAPTLEIGGTGPLTDRDPGRFGIRLKAASTDVLEHLFLEYRRPGFHVAFGDQSFTPSPLASGASGFGVSVGREWTLSPSALLSGTLQAYLASGSPALGAAVTAKLERGTELGASVHASEDGLLGTVRVRHAPRTIDPTLLQITNVEAVYAARAGGGAGSGQSVRFGVRIQEGPSFADIAYGATGAGFSGADDHRASFGVKGVMRLNEALRVEPRYPLDLHFEYAEAWGGSPSGALLLLPAATAARHVQTFGAGLSAGVGPVALNGSYRRSSESGATGTVQEQRLGALMRVSLANEASFAQSLHWNLDTAGGGITRDALEYEAATSHRTRGDGRLGTLLAIDYDLLADAIGEIALGARWSGDLVDDLEVRADGRLHLVAPSDLLSADVTVHRLFGNGSALDVAMRARAYRDRPLAVAFGVGYAFSLHVPLGRRSGIGEVHGNVAHVDGGPVPGLIVAIAGQAVTTRADGGFAFPAVPEGEHLLHVLSTDVLSPTQILAPSAPHRITVLRGERTAVDFVVTEGADVTGRLRMPPVERSGRDAIVGSTLAGPDARLVGGVRIELRDDTTVLHAVTDADGAFRFQRLRPGSWTLRVLHPRLPPEYRLEPAERSLELTAGESEDVTVELIPVVRRIQFSEGGTLGGSSPD